MFKPNVFGCLPSSGLKMTVRTHAYISYVILPPLEQTSFFLCLQTFPNGNYIRYIGMRADGHF